jgi:uncharacterized membrane protein
MRNRITVSSFLTMALIPAPSMAQERPWEWGWGMHPGWWMWGAGGLVMMLMMLAFWGLMIAGLVLGVRWLVSQGRNERPDRALARSCASGTRVERSTRKSSRRGVAILAVVGRKRTA